MPESTRRSTRSHNHLDVLPAESSIPETYTVVTKGSDIVSRLVDAQKTRQNISLAPPPVSFFDWEKESPSGRGARGSQKVDPLTDGVYIKLNAFPETLERRTTKLERDRLYVEKQRLVNTLGEYKAKISALAARSDIQTGFESHVDAIQKKIHRLDDIFAIGERVAANADSVPHPGPSLSATRSKRRPESSHDDQEQESNYRKLVTAKLKPLENKPVPSKSKSVEKEPVASKSKSIEKEPNASKLKLVENKHVDSNSKSVEKKPVTSKSKSVENKSIISKNHKAPSTRNNKIPENAPKRSKSAKIDNGTHNSQPRQVNSEIHTNEPRPTDTNFDIEQPVPIFGEREIPPDLKPVVQDSSKLPDSFFQSDALRASALTSRKPGSRSLYAFGEKIPTTVLEAQENFDLVPEGWLRAYENGWDSEELGLGKIDDFQKIIETRLNRRK